MKIKLESGILKNLETILKKIYYFTRDIIYRSNDRDSMLPPKSMIFVGDGDFEKIGQEFKQYFIQLSKLQPNDRVLDVGCGIGRMAIPLTDYLSIEGGYWGFDIAKDGVEWCQNHISKKFSNFNFRHIDVYNKYYNQHGNARAYNFNFPYENEFFDFVFLTSVFTHMLPPDMENYMNEISRVLKAGGKCMITFFLLNEESEKLLRIGRSTLDFRHKIDGYLTINSEDPETAIAYNEGSVIRLFEKYGLEIIQPIHYGSWCERDNFLSYQDIIIALKEITN